jgi:hypothetical protein
VTRRLPSQISTSPSTLADASCVALAVAVASSENQGSAILRVDQEESVGVHGQPEYTPRPGQSSDARQQLPAGAARRIAYRREMDLQERGEALGKAAPSP